MAVSSLPYFNQNICLKSFIISGSLVSKYLTLAVYLCSLYRFVTHLLNDSLSLETLYIEHKWKHIAIVMLSLVL